MTDFIISLNFSCQKGTLVFEKAYFDLVSDKTSTGLVNISFTFKYKQNTLFNSINRKKASSHDFVCSR